MTTITDVAAGRQLLMEYYATDDGGELGDWLWDRKEEIFDALAAIERVRSLAYEWASATAADEDDPKTTALYGRQVFAALEGWRPR